MSRYDIPKNKYFDEPKTKHDAKDYRPVNKEIDEFAKNLIDKRYKLSRSKSRFLGYVKKQNQ